MVRTCCNLAVLRLAVLCLAVLRLALSSRSQVPSHALAWLCLFDRVGELLHFAFLQPMRWFDRACNFDAVAGDLAVHLTNIVKSKYFITWNMEQRNRSLRAAHRSGHLGPHLHSLLLCCAMAISSAVDGASVPTDNEITTQRFDTAPSTPRTRLSTLLLPSQSTTLPINRTQSGATPPAWQAIISAPAVPRPWPRVRLIDKWRATIHFVAHHHVRSACVEHCHEHRRRITLREKPWPPLPSANAWWPIRRRPGSTSSINCKIRLAYQTWFCDLRAVHFSSM